MSLFLFLWGTNFLSRPLFKGFSSFFTNTFFNFFSRFHFFFHGKKNTAYHSTEPSPLIKSIFHRIRVNIWIPNIKTIFCYRRLTGRNTIPETKIYNYYPHKDRQSINFFAILDLQSYTWKYDLLCFFLRNNSVLMTFSLYEDDSE